MDETYIEKKPFIIDPEGYDTRTRVQTYRKVYEINGKTRVFTNNRQLTSTVTSKRGSRQLKDAYGWLPPNRFVLIKNTGHMSGGKAVYTRRRDDWLLLEDRNQSELFYSTEYPAYYGEFAEPINVVTRYKAEVQAAVYQANLEAYARLNSPDFAGWALIMEAKETVKWLREIAFKAITITRRFLSQVEGYESRIKKPKKQVNLLFSEDFERFVDEGSYLGSLWMQYRYAIMPLLLTVRDFQELLIRDLAELKSYTGYVTSKVKISDKTSGYSTGTPSFLTYDDRTSVTLDIRGAVKLYPRFIKSNGDMGLSPYDFLLGGYAVTKLSWVLDWFVDVSTWLAAWRPTNAQIQYQSNTSVLNVTTKRVITTTGSRPVGTDTTDLKVLTPEVITTTTSWVERDINIYKNMLPAFTQEALSLQRQIDSVALTFNVLGTLVRKGKPSSRS